jgi:hypothetical protein
MSFNSLDENTSVIKENMQAVFDAVLEVTGAVHVP